MSPALASSYYHFQPSKLHERTWGSDSSPSRHIGIHREDPSPDKLVEQIGQPLLLLLTQSTAGGVFGAQRVDRSVRIVCSVLRAFTAIIRATTLPYSIFAGVLHWFTSL